MFNKICLVLLLPIAFSAKSQWFSSLNYFYNLGYYNPAFSSKNIVQVDVSSLSLYNNLPSGVSANTLFCSFKTGQDIMFSGQFSSASLGKATKISNAQINANYTTDINLKHKLSFGLGVKFFGQRYDESQLIRDVDLSTFSYDFGTDLTRSSFLQIPIGISLKNKKIETGFYYAKGVTTSDAYGGYIKSFIFKTEVNGYQLNDYLGIAFSKELINPKLSLENSFEVDNYKLDLFYFYNLSGLEKSYQSYGAGLFYNWRVFNINYQLAFNTNALGLSHHIGIQFFLQ